MLKLKYENVILQFITKNDDKKIKMPAILYSYGASSFSNVR